MRYPILPIGAFIAAFLVLIPAFWLWRAGNVPTLSLIVWLFTLNIIYGVNSLLWSDSIWDKTPIWCDISAKLIVGASTAVPACTLCICRYLAMIGGNKTVGLGRNDRRRIMIFDFGFCWGIPMIFMALHYLVQGHRYNIVQHMGCQSATYISTPVIFIMWLPPLFLCLGTLAYAAIALYYFVQMRVVFSSILQVSDSPMSTNRYIRLIAMSATLALWGIALTLVTMWANASRGLQPWVSLENVHSGWDHVEAYVWMLMSPRSRSRMLLSWWAIPVSSVVVFVFLGFGEDAMNSYKKIGNAIKSVFSSRVLPERNEKFGKGMLLASPVLDPSSSKTLPLYFQNPSYVASPMSTRITEKAPGFREFILPLPNLTRTKTTSKPRPKSTLSTPDSSSSLKPLRPHVYPRAVDSAFYFHPTSPHSISHRSELTQFSMSDDHIAFGQTYGPSTPPSINVSAMDQSFRELPPIQPLRSLNSMMGISKAQPQPSVQLGEKRQPAPLKLDLAEGRLRDCSSRMKSVAIAEPREALLRGSVQVTVQR